MKRLIRLWAVLLVFFGIVAYPIYAQSDDPHALIHVVQRGETLSQIAQNYGLSTAHLSNVNNITNPSSIWVGQRLIVPTDAEQFPLVVEAIHQVRPGETLRSIANRYGTTVEALLQLNNITNANVIYVGQQIKVRADSPETVVQENVNVEQLNLPSLIHVVQRGETLFGIATTYGVSMADVQQANKITNPSRIYVGQELTIVGATDQILGDNPELPSIIREINLNPLVLAEGQTSQVILSTTSPALIEGRFLDRTIPFFTADDSIRHVGFLAVPIFTEPSIYPFEVVIKTPDGQVHNLTLNIQVTLGTYGTQRIFLPEDRMNLLGTGVEENEEQIMQRVVTAITRERYFQNAMSLPAASAMNAPFGAKRSYNGGDYDRYHRGADFASPTGAPVLATAPGRVVLADTLHICGVALAIDHGWGVYTVYCHMSERLVQLGDFVTAGQTIGLVGSSGRATGAHLHWELWVNGVAVDPLQWTRVNFQ